MNDFLEKENQNMENEYQDAEATYKENGFKAFIEKYKSTPFFWLGLILAILLLIILLLLFLNRQGKLQNIKIDLPSIIYVDEATTVKSTAIGKGKLNKTTHSFSVSNPNIVDLERTSVIGEEVTTNITPITTGKIKLSALGNLGNTKTPVVEKDILICRRLSSKSIQNTSLSIIKDKTSSLNLDLGTEEECYKDISYKMENTSIATIDKNGKITGKKKGVTILSISTETEDVEIDITVIDPKNEKKVTGINVNKASVTIPRGTKTTVTATIAPNDATNKEILWITSNSKVATVSNNGEIVGVGVGNATITAVTKDGGYKKTIAVTVTQPVTQPPTNQTKTKNVAVTKVEASKTKTTIKVGDKERLTAKALPSNATNKSIEWKSDNPTVASVNRTGIITAHKIGTAKITAISHNNKKATITVTVTNKAIAVNKISLSPTAVTLKINEEKIINVILTPSNATNQTITWTTNDSSVATVNNGKITAKKVGTTTITARTSNGKTANVTVTVKNQTTPSTSSGKYSVTYDSNTSNKAVLGSMTQKTYDTGKTATLSENNYKLTGWTFVGWWANKGKQYFGCPSNEIYKSGCGTWKNSSELKSIAIYANKSQIGFSKNLNANDKVTMKALWGKVSSGKITEVKNNKIKFTANFVLPMRSTWAIRVYNGNEVKELYRYYVGTTNTYSKAYTYTGEVEKGKTEYIHVNACLVQNEKTTSTCINKITLYTSSKYTIEYNGNTSNKNLKGTMTSSSHDVGQTATLSKNQYSLSGWKFAGWWVTKGSQYFGNTNTDTKKTGYMSNKGVWNTSDKLTTIAIYSDGTKLGFSPKLKGNDKVTMKALWIRAFDGKFVKSTSDKIEVSAKFTLPTKTTWAIRMSNGITTEVKETKYINTNTYSKAYAFTGSIKKGTTGKVYVNACLVQNNKVTTICTQSLTILSNEIIVTYLPNNGTGTMASQTFEKGKAENLNANKFTRTGWTFAGWAANKNGKVLGCTTLKSCELSEAQYNDSAKIKSYAIYKDKQSVKDIASPGETVKLVAIWAKMASAEKTNCTKTACDIKWNLTSTTKTSWDVYYDDKKSSSSGKISDTSNSLSGTMTDFALQSSERTVKVKACLTIDSSVCTDEISVSLPKKEVTAPSSSSGSSSSGSSSGSSSSGGSSSGSSSSGGASSGSSSSGGSSSGGTTNNNQNTTTLKCCNKNTYEWGGTYDMNKCIFGVYSEEECINENPANHKVTCAIKQSNLSTNTKFKLGYWEHTISVTNTTTCSSKVGMAFVETGYALLTWHLVSGDMKSGGALTVYDHKCSFSGVETLICQETYKGTIETWYKPLTVQFFMPAGQLSNTLHSAVNGVTNAPKISIGY